MTVNRNALSYDLKTLRRDLFPNELSAQTSGAIVEPLDRSGYSIIY
jgi:hypothetical protein